MESLDYKGSRFLESPDIDFWGSGGVVLLVSRTPRHLGVVLDRSRKSGGRHPAILLPQRILVDGELVTF